MKPRNVVPEGSSSPRTPGLWCPPGINTRVQSGDASKSCRTYITKLCDRCVLNGRETRGGKTKGAMDVGGRWVLVGDTKVHPGGGVLMGVSVTVLYIYSVFATLRCVTTNPCYVEENEIVRSTVGTRRRKSTEIWTSFRQFRHVVNDTIFCAIEIAIAS